MRYKSKGSLSADLIFCYFLIKQKVMGLRGQERDDYLIYRYLYFYPATPSLAYAAACDDPVRMLVT
jgi:hypothetical protein